MEIARAFTEASARGMTNKSSVRHNNIPVHWVKLSIMYWADDKSTNYSIRGICWDRKYCAHVIRTTAASNCSFVQRVP